MVGSGKYTYEMNEEWARLPEGWEMPAAAVAVDSQDRVFVFKQVARTSLSPYLIGMVTTCHPGVRASLPFPTPF